MRSSFPKLLDAPENRDQCEILEEDLIKEES